MKKLLFPLALSILIASCSGNSTQMRTDLEAANLKGKVMKVEKAKDGIELILVPCNDLADKVGNPKGANIAMVGAIVKALGDFTKDEGINGMNDMFRKKGEDKYEELNVKAFLEGYEYIR